jgi:hypothetical protein
MDDFGDLKQYHNISLYLLNKSNQKASGDLL